MIGVAYADGREPLARELFQLFKISWSPWSPNEEYDAVIAMGCDPPSAGRRCTIVYSAGPLASDATREWRIEPDGDGPSATHAVTGRFHIPGPTGTVVGPGDPIVVAESGAVLGRALREGASVSTRLGYDLLDVVERLLTDGQPAHRAGEPTLERHVSLLRHLLHAAGAAFVEILPRPEGHDLVVALTHDVDFVGIRHHLFDRTFLGYVYRASIGSLVRLMRGRIRLADALRNFLAVLSLPLVYLRLVPDPMNCFLRYAELDGDAASTYFVIPYRGHGGRCETESVQAERAVKYAPADIAGELRAVTSRRAEVALHGIDAWVDPQRGRDELGKIDAVLPDRASPGVRMHWLFWDADSPSVLEEAGFVYDSTVGYNDAVGFRAGTAQPFVPPGCTTLLEIPLTVQDTALFYPARMNLREGPAWEVVEAVVEEVGVHGGVFVLNWHQRSLGPERCWDRFYARLVAHLRARTGWLVTLTVARSWFVARRALRLVRVGHDDSRQFALTGSWPADLPLPVVVCHGGATAAVELEREGAVVA